MILIWERFKKYKFLLRWQSLYENIVYIKRRINLKFLGTWTRQPDIELSGTVKS